MSALAKVSAFCLGTVAIAFLTVPASAEIVMLNAYTVWDYTIPGDSYVGELQFEHLVYDSTQVDPVTHRVPLLNQQHKIFGHYFPARATADEHMEGSWLDMSKLPYRYHRWSKVKHGVDIVVDATEDGRLSMRKASDLSILVSGHYWIDPTPITGPEATAAGTPAPPGAPAAPEGPPPVKTK